ncbi:MAG: diguanylate cyclase [Ferrovibrionaceae bacterium]
MSKTIDKLAAYRRIPRRAAAGDPFSSLASQPASPGLRALALWFCVVLGAITVATLPFSSQIGPPIPAFLPIVQTLSASNYLVTAYLIFGHYRGTGNPALLYVGCGSLYTGLLMIIQFLAFPGQILPDRAVFTGGPQTMIWLWCFWHLGPFLGILIYTASDRLLPRAAAHEGRRGAAWTALGVTLVLFVATVAMVTVGHDHLLPLDRDGRLNQMTSWGPGPLIVAMMAGALVLFWHTTHFRTVLQVSLGVAFFALLLDCAVTIAGASRYAIGWYIGRMFGVVSSAMLLLLYLHEINRAYMATAADAQRLARSNERLEAEVEKHTAEAITARHDALTGLPGRTHFLELAAALHRECATRKRPLAVLFIDLDGFKQVNDILGHARGDAVLVAVARILAGVVRSGDLVGRLGGDEFVICMAGAPDGVKATAAAVAQRIVDAVARVGDGIGCSVGVAYCSPDTLGFDVALARADAAMYDAKRNGKNRVSVGLMPAPTDGFPIDRR